MCLDKGSEPDLDPAVHFRTKSPNLTSLGDIRNVTHMRLYVNRQNRDIERSMGQTHHVASVDGRGALDPGSLPRAHRVQQDARAVEVEAVGPLGGIWWLAFDKPCRHKARYVGIENNHPRHDTDYGIHNLMGDLPMVRWSV